VAVGDAPKLLRLEIEGGRRPDNIGNGVGWGRWKRRGLDHADRIDRHRVIAQPEIVSGAMARPRKPPFLNPRQPKNGLAWSMQTARLVHRWDGKQVAEAFGCSPPHISRVEQGSTMPSRELVRFYDATFEADGLLLSLFEVAIHAAEQTRRRAYGKRRRQGRKLPGDASTFLEETVANGRCFKPGEVFQKQWRIRNSGTVPWRGRRLERQGPITGPGLITSERYVAIPDTAPSEIATIQALLKAPTYDCTSICYFKQVDEEGFLCFPDNYQLGLEVIVRVEGQVPDAEAGSSGS